MAAMLLQSTTTVAAILAGMAALAFVETVLPLHVGARPGRARVRVNLTLTSIAFATNALLNSGLVMLLLLQERFEVGLLNVFPQARVVELLVVLLGLDLAFYAAHVAMHKVPALWRYHAVHHSDPVVDVTTTIRQHPGESVVRYAFIAVSAAALGASPAAFAVYRTWSVLVALLEHANVGLPLRLDDAFALVSASPNMHKVHHSRTPAETDSNYGNVFSVWDRLFGTFTPASRGTAVACGLDELDGEDVQTVTGLLSLPFRARRGRSRAGDAHSS